MVFWLSFSFLRPSVRLFFKVSIVAYVSPSLLPFLVFMILSIRLWFSGSYSLMGFQLSFSFLRLLLYYSWKSLLFLKFPLLFFLSCRLFFFQFVYSLQLNLSLSFTPARLPLYIPLSSITCSPFYLLSFALPSSSLSLLSLAYLLPTLPTLPSPYRPLLSLLPTLPCSPFSLPSLALPTLPYSPLVSLLPPLPCSILPTLPCSPTLSYFPTLSHSPLLPSSYPPMLSLLSLLPCTPPPSGAAWG